MSLKFKDMIANTQSGLVVAEANTVQRELELVGSLPVHVTQHVTARCTPNSPQPGREIVISFELTINENGKITSVHELVRT
jgi:hypothetical protein